jgi:hypothetical protein
MFQYGQLGNALFQVQHQHSDGSWGTMEPEEQEHHDPAEHDPEREWERGHVFICRSCGERVRVTMPEGDAPTGS